MIEKIMFSIIHVEEYEMKENGNILSEIQERRSYRGISTQKIEKNTVARLIKAAHFAPSCFNKQPWRFISVQSDEGLNKVKKGLNKGNSWAYEAPLFILVCTKDDYDCQLDDGRHYAEFDTGMSVYSLLLQAQKEGLIGHPIAGYDQELLKKEFAIPEEVRLLTVIILGYKGGTEALNEKQLESENGPRVRNPLEKWYAEETWRF